MIDPLVDLLGSLSRMEERRREAVRLQLKRIKTLGYEFVGFETHRYVTLFLVLGSWFDNIT